MLCTYTFRMLKDDRAKLQNIHKNQHTFHSGRGHQDDRAKNRSKSHEGVVGGTRMVEPEAVQKIFRDLIIKWDPEVGLGRF